MVGTRRRRALAGVLSLLLPGAGQLYVGRRRRGLALLGITAAGLLGLLLLVSADTAVHIDRTFVAAVLAANLALLAFRLFAVVDAARGGLTAALAALVVLTAAPHVALGWVTFRSYDVLESVFADEEPCGSGCDRRAVLLSQAPTKDAWERSVGGRLAPTEVAALKRSALAGAEPAEQKAWTTILLLGTDEGPGNWGARTDTIILAAIQHSTGRAAAFGIPRNLVQVPLGDRRKPSREPLNALYALNGGGAQGASALKRAVSNLLGMRIDYYAVANLLGFADLVDALGGVEIEVKERLRDEVTRPAWGEPKPRIDVEPGRTYRLYGREALAYVRSRKDSSDYTRMARQRCFLSAMAEQLDPVQALRNFGSLARTIEANIRTDVPLNRLPALVRLVAGIEPSETLTVTFGTEYFFGRRPKDRHPVPNVSRMQATARNAILRPALLRKSGRAKTARESC